MIQSKLILLLKTFSEEEMEACTLFLKSPYHNTDSKLVSLFKLIYTAYPEFEREKVDRRLIFEHLFQGKEYQDLKLRRLISNLLKKIESWMVIREIEGDNFENAIRLSAIYRKKELEKHRAGSLRTANNELESVDYQSLNSVWNNYRFSIERETPENQRLGKSENLTSVSDSLDQFYLLGKLKYACILLNQQNVLQQAFHIQMIDEVLEHLSRNRYDLPLLNLYYRAFLTLRFPDQEENFFILKGLLENTGGLLPREEGEQIHALARNYCIRQSNLGNSSYMRNLFELYQVALTGGLLISEEGEMSPPFFKNIILAGLRLSEYDWVEGFIKEFSTYLPEREREDFLYFNLARVNFEKGAYENAIPLLGKVGQEDLFLIMDSRTLRLKTWYELEKIELVESGISGFKMLIRRNKMLAYHRKNYLNFLRFLKFLVRVNPFDKEALSTLKTKIELASPLTEKEWLLKKLQGL